MSHIEKPHAHFLSFIAASLEADAHAIANDWLMRLVDVVQEARRDIFPTEEYLDHVPQMIREMGLVLLHPDYELAMANSVINSKARELGRLRHQQEASVNQLLREYDLLARVLEAYVADRTRAYDGEINFSDGIGIMSFFARMVRTIMQATIDCFVELYSDTISQQTEKILSFNSFISHELKTPMQSAMLNVELMMATRPAEHPDLEGLQKVEAAITQMASLLGNLETLVANESFDHASHAASQQIELSAAIADVASRFSDSLTMRDIELRIQPELGVITVDRSRLETVISNILTNAIKYSDGAKAQRTIEIVSAGNRSDTHIAFTITDNGLGMDQAVIERVFDLYYRGRSDEQTQPDVQGHGIGLYLVREVVREMGGTVTVESSRGHWTRFTLELPCIRSEDYRNRSSD